MQKGPWGLTAGLGVLGLGLVLATVELRRQRGRLDVLESRLAAAERAALRPAEGEAPSRPEDTTPVLVRPTGPAPGPSAAPAPSPGPDGSDPGRSASAEEIKKAVQEVLREKEAAQETDWLVDSWDWDSIGEGLSLDPALAAQMKSVWEDYGRQLKALSEQAKGDPAARRVLAEKADEFQRSFYEQFRGSLDPSQLAGLKGGLADLDVEGYVVDAGNGGALSVTPPAPGARAERVPSFPYEEAEALRMWNWNSVPKRLNLNESLRPFFDDALRQLNEFADRMRGDAGMVAALRQRERELRQAFLDQSAAQLTPDQLDRLKRRFQAADNDLVK